jgi:hypothetical protein
MQNILRSIAGLFPPSEENVDLYNEPRQDASTKMPPKPVTHKAGSSSGKTDAEAMDIRDSSDEDDGVPPPSWARKLMKSFKSPENRFGSHETKVQNQIADSENRMQEKIADTGKHLAAQIDEVVESTTSISDRVLRLESSVDSPRALARVSKPTLLQLLTSEDARLTRLLEDAVSMEGTVIIGKQQSAPEKQYSEAVVRNTVAKLSVSGCSVAPRGYTGIFAVSFKQVAGHTPAIRARSFVLKLSQYQASRVMWAQLDRPKELRFHDRRARTFARCFKAKLVDPKAQPGARSPVFFTVEKGFLLINDSPIAPISLVPDEELWPQLNDLVLELIKNSKHPLANRTKSLVSQLHKPIAEFLYDAYTSIPDDLPTYSCQDDGDLGYLLDDDLEPMNAPPVVPPDGLDLFAPLDSVPPKS